MSTAISHCIILPEILDIVCRYLSRGELACLARSSRFFFHSATRELWSSWPVEDKDILNLLPDSLVTKPDEKITRFEVHIPAVLPPKYFERLSVYAPFIKHMTVSLAWGQDQEYIQQQHLPGWPKVAGYARNHVLLPNLRKVEVHERYSSTTSSRACSDWLRVLIPPSLSHLDLIRNFVDDSPGCIERYLDLIEDILSKTSNHLERLKIHTTEPPISQLSDAAPNDPASQPLMPGALVSRALKQIVGMPRLRKLEIPELSTVEVPDLSASSTCQLESLQIACGVVEPLFHIWRTPIPAHLTRLCLSTNWPSATTTSAINELHDLTTLIAALSDAAPNDPASQPLMPGTLVSRALKQIVGMPRLRKLEIPELSTVEVPDLSASSTCQLESFQIACGVVEPLFHIWRTPIPAHLTRLCLSTNWPTATTTSAINELHDLTTLIAAVSPNITRISFYLADIPDTEYLLDILYPLHTLQLTELIVNGVQLTEPVQQVSLRTIAEYWPLLEVLELRHVGTSFNELVTVSSYLPRLTCLLLQLESTIPPELLAEDTAAQLDIRPSRELELVSDFRCVHTFNPTETNVFAKFLTKIWPSVNIKCYCRGYNHGPEYEEFKVVLAQHINGTPPVVTA
ncbi:hypothetical protein RSAG8_10009, partial [Rhizoctonia solani AG-8 WAC10335]